MKNPPWPTNPTDPEKAEYARLIHACIEDNVNKLGRRITLAGVSTAVALVVAITGATMTAGKWFADRAVRDEKIDTSLKTLIEVVRDQKAQNAKVDELSTQMRIMQATSQDNNTALLGPNSASNRRAAKRAGR